MNEGFYGWSRGGNNLFVPQSAQYTPPPMASAWAWVEQGTCTASDLATGGITLNIPSQSGDYPRGMVRALPPAPWSVTACTQGGLYSSSGAYGLFLRQSSSGTKTVWMVQPTNNFRCWNYNATSWAGSAQGFEATASGPWTWWRITDDGTASGTARKYYISADGLTWFQCGAVSRTSFLTPDQVGVGGDPAASGGSSNITFNLVSWTGA